MIKYKTKGHSELQQKIAIFLIPVYLNIFRSRFLNKIQERTQKLRYTKESPLFLNSLRRYGWGVFTTVKHLSKPLTMFAKRLNLDIPQGSK